MTSYYPKRFKRHNITHQRIYHSRQTSFFPKKTSLFKKSTSFKKFAIQIHPFKKKKKSFIIFLWNLSWIFEILDFLLKCHSLSWILNFSFELWNFFLSDVSLEVLDFSLEHWIFFFFLNLLNFLQQLSHINIIDHTRFGSNISRQNQSTTGHIRLGPNTSGQNQLQQVTSS